MSPKYTRLAGGIGVPLVQWFGTKCVCDYNAMVVDFWVPRCSLKDLFNFCNHKFSLKTVLLLTDQLGTVYLVFELLDIPQHLFSSYIYIGTAGGTMVRKPTKSMENLPLYR